ncbi:hypothetical protein C2E23DRAFT_817960 [Lenzites betulinus]|nr:hypothetical protein C2E23DRAFT_817960 [Lenzites betulinus]
MRLARAHDGDRVARFAQPTVRAAVVVYVHGRATGGRPDVPLAKQQELYQFYHVRGWHGLMTRASRVCPTHRSRSLTAALSCLSIPHIPTHSRRERGVRPPRGGPETCHTLLDPPRCLKSTPSQHEQSWVPGARGASALRSARAYLLPAVHYSL